ncbi:DMT family transporter [Pseudoalteromonas carrageenovora]|nr:MULTISPECIES: DMT family transporter [Pseudoalteromonas]KTF11985.1 multidrug DMT transporter permease [Pseudoalteromonas sp. H103]MDO6635558.1 DMT family transporter [Pseudoalteromonas carrageenovora]MDO6648224.1 DMT family transporter [Pseudoalteromonas carrageenovora]
MKATLYTLIALIAFAANSLFCRMALAQGYIDPWNFTIIRLLSGAACLGIIMGVYSYNLKRKGAFNREILNDRGSWRSSISLLVYALSFSIAYVELDTGTGALILFSAVQLTMIGWGIYQKEQLSALQWAAFIVALGGFVYLMLPSAAVPSVLGASLMALSGVAWGIYSIRGKVCVSPLRTTGFNFIRSLVAVPILLLVGMSYIKTVSIEGVLLACASGAIASGVGYSIWYVAMPLLKSTQAAVVQLCVPVLAAVAGVLFLSEQLTVEFVIASSLILGAVLVFILNKHKA